MYAFRKGSLVLPLVPWVLGSVLVLLPFVGNQRLVCLGCSLFLSAFSLWLFAAVWFVRTDSCGVCMNVVSLGCVNQSVAFLVRNAALSYSFERLLVEMFVLRSSPRWSANHAYRNSLWQHWYECFCVSPFYLGTFCRMKVVFFVALACQTFGACFCVDIGSFLLLFLCLTERNTLLVSVRPCLLSLPPPSQVPTLAP